MGSVIAAVLVAIVSGVVGYMSSERTNQTNRELSLQQQAYDEKMFDKQNQYNDPVHQSERMRLAGLNPSAIGMANGTSVVGNYSASPNGYQLPAQLDPFLNASNGLLSVASAFNQYQSGKDSQTLRQARLDEIRATVDNLKANATKLGVDADGQRIINKYADEMNKWAVAGQKAEVAVKRASARLTDAQFKSVQQDLSMYKIKVSQALKSLELTQSEIDNNYLNLDWVASKILSTHAETNKLNAEANLINAQTSKTEAETGLVNAQTVKTESDIETAQSSLPYILQQYEVTIENIKSQTGWTDEQTYWYVIRLMSESTPSTLGGRKVKIGDVLGREMNKRLGERYFNVQ